MVTTGNPSQQSDVCFHFGQYCHFSYLNQSVLQTKWKENKSKIEYKKENMETDLREWLK